MRRNTEHVRGKRSFECGRTALCFASNLTAMICSTTCLSMLGDDCYARRSLDGLRGAPAVTHTSEARGPVPRARGVRETQRTQLVEAIRRHHAAFALGSDSVLSRKSPLFAGFSVIPSDRSPNAALPGWRCSADRTGLRANSLQTGNFTGNFAKAGHNERSAGQKSQSCQAVLSHFPTRITGKHFWLSGKLSA